MSDADCTPGREPRSVAASIILRCSGLSGEHLLPAGVARPQTQLRAAECQAGQDPTGLRRAEEHLDPGHVLSEREARPVPRGHRRQPADASEQTGRRLVRQQVSIYDSYTSTPSVNLIAVQWLR